MGRLKSQNLSIMMTDIQGYSAKSAETSRADMIRYIRGHNKLMMPIIEFYGGTIIKSIGDAFLCTFQSATDAVICAIIIQLILREYNKKQEDKSKKMKLRVVVNSGDVTLEEGDIFGNAVNTTARMEGLPCFPGGTIGISESTYLLMDKAEIKAELLGPKTMKGIAEPVNVYKVPIEDQKLSTLPAHLLDLVEKVVSMEEEKGNKSEQTHSQWKESLFGYLKEKNWGQNLGENLEIAGKHIKENLTNAHSKISSTLNKKTAAEKSKANQTKASTSTRIKCFAIDAVLLILLLVVVKIAWWPVQSIVFGSTTLSQREYSKLDYTSPLKSKYTYNYDTNDYERSMGIAEGFIQANVSFPILPYFLYFALFWAIKGATIGQLIGGSAVVMSDGSKLSFIVAAKRSAIFLISGMIIFIGMLPLFGKEKQTLYDMICNTKVIE